MRCTKQAVFAYACLLVMANDRACLQPRSFPHQHRHYIVFLDFGEVAVYFVSFSATLVLFMLIRLQSKAMAIGAWFLPGARDFASLAVHPNCFTLPLIHILT